MSDNDNETTEKATESVEDTTDPAEGTTDPSDSTTDRPQRTTRDGTAVARRRIMHSTRVRRWAVAGVIVALLVATGVSLWQVRSLHTQLDDERAQNADAARAQQIATDYAVAAARIDYRNFDPWFASLRRGVNDRLANQFASSEPALRDLLGQLQWVSTGTLVGSDISAQHDGRYEVQVFVDVTTSNVQSPDGVKTTALYPITIEKQGWRISDISGGVAPIPGK